MNHTRAHYLSVRLSRPERDKLAQLCDIFGATSLAEAVRLAIERVWFEEQQRLNRSKGL